jgi:hypothetical protein
MYNRIQVDLHDRLVYFLLQELHHLFKLEKPRAFDQDRFFLKRAGTELL